MGQEEWKLDEMAGRVVLKVLWSLILGVLDTHLILWMFGVDPRMAIMVAMMIGLPAGAAMMTTADIVNSKLPAEREVSPRDLTLANAVINGIVVRLALWPLAMGEAHFLGWLFGVTW